MSGQTRFEAFLDQAWTDHGEAAASVLARIPDGFALIETGEQLAALAHLTAHVAGEHLGAWREGITLLERLANVSAYDAVSESGRSLRRHTAVLATCAGMTELAATYARQARSDDLREATERIRILAPAAAAMASQRCTQEAVAMFEEAVTLAAYGPVAGDPAARALAAAGNNIAAALEEFSDRTPAETRLMVRAAQVAREFWEIAGTWLQVQRAEYRLAMTMIAAGDGAAAVRHAEACAALCAQHAADAYERFWASEALACAYWQCGDGKQAAAAREQAATLVAEVGSLQVELCRAGLRKLDALLARA